MDLFDAFPSLRQSPSLEEKKVRLLSVSTIVRDEEAVYFEIRSPRYWGTRDDGTRTVGVGAVGGSIAKDESVVDCMHREVKAKLGARARLQLSEQTALIDGDEVVDRVSIVPSKKRPSPLMILLYPPRLGGPGMPDRVAVVVLEATLQDAVVPRGVFGVLRVESSALHEFLAEDESAVESVEAHPDLALVVKGDLPEDSVLRPVLAIKALRNRNRQLEDE